MIVRCNVSCKLNGGTTDVSLDVDENKAICNECGEEVVNISSYSKLSMKKNGDVLRSKNRKAFMFPCQTCNMDVEASVVSGVVIGAQCPNSGKGCKINITKHMVCAIESSSQSKIEQG
jgi:hypothetical protein